MIELFINCWWAYTTTQPFLGLGLALIFAILLVALASSLIFGLTLLIIRDFSLESFLGGLKMGFVSALKFQWDFILIIFALIITFGLVSSFTCK